MSGEFGFSDTSGSSLQFELSKADSEDWIPTAIRFQTPSLSGVTGATIRWGDFDRFAADLTACSESLPSDLTFENEEGNIDLTIRLDQLGRGKVSAVIRVSGAEVLMQVETDQAVVRRAASGLRRALAATGRGNPA